LFWLYTEPERRVSFENKQQSSLFFQALYITKTNNKLTLLSGSVYKQNKQQNSLFFQTLEKSEFCCLFCLYTEPERRVSFVVCFVYIQSLKEE
jgi:hypothetical protein